MNYNQLKKINQITDQTLIIGTDVSKNFHVSRAQDFRGIEFGKSIRFNNDIIGILEFEKWFKQLMTDNGKTEVIIGMEPTGHYWIPLARCLKKMGYNVVTVNPAATKKAKELDDNNQSKTDHRDARVIAQLVKDGRYTEPNLLDGLYEELREVTKIKRILTGDMVRTKNQITNWFDRYFPEYTKVYKQWNKKTLLWIIKKYRFPILIAKLDPEKIYLEIKKDIKKGIGRTKVKEIIDAAKTSIGITEGLKSASIEFDYLISKYEKFTDDLINLDIYIQELIQGYDETSRIKDINGIGLNTAAGLISELGAISQYKSPKQLSKMAGLSLVEDSSGKKRGKRVISKRGRSNLRKLLYQCIVSMLRHNKEFQELYAYYTKRNINPLTGKEAIIALMNKLLRIIHALITKKVKYDPEKMLNDIKRQEGYFVVA